MRDQPLAQFPEPSLERVQQSRTARMYEYDCTRDVKFVY
jgi:hypothetical protein